MSDSPRRIVEPVDLSCVDLSSSQVPPVTCKLPQQVTAGFPQKSYGMIKNHEEISYKMQKAFDITSIYS